ncbi:putative bifunctional diguanylate cyclase/phosphodiesterase [Paenibacillus sp. GCM10027627]|uniref:putative bifunctional diguanylate cyclase/phosphodiesterase n=1 Tax=unclassified Paenibacillus TaxID=185978 RepID=UPI0036345263
MKNESWIIQSKERCAGWGIDPEVVPNFTKYYSEAELAQKRQEYEEILSVIDFFVNRMLELMKGLPLLILISDEKGCILEMAGDETIKSLVNQSGISEGLVFTEEEAGTNSISLVLAHREAFQLIGRDHYYHFLEMSACYTVPFQHADNNHLLGTITIMTSVDQHNPFLLAMLCTVVDSINRELLLKKQNRRLHILNQVVIETTRNGIIITDKDGEITEYNEFAEYIADLKERETLQKAGIGLKIDQYINEVLHKGVVYEDMELSIRKNSEDEKLVCLFDAFPIHDENKTIMGAFAQFRDITERFKAEQQINHLAYHDDLTGLPNRRLFTQKLTQLLECADGDRQPFALMFLDLDSFKKINDNLGHNHGDALLKQVAERLKRCCLSADHSVSRMGGDEFTILLKELKKQEEAIKVAESVIKEFESPFVVDEYEFYITASIGLAYYPQDGTDAKTIMKHADIAMYQAKDSGKNNYAVYKAAKSNIGMEQLTLENSIRKALQNDEFVLHYQPQIDLETGDIIGTEALIRWQHPKLGIIPPSKFIPIAEETGLIVPIGEWVMRTACKQNQEWMSKGFEPMKISVNLSSRQFLRRDLVQTVKNILKETGHDPNLLELEITESMTMDVDFAIEVLGELKKLGLHICIDDFGTGYSNLYYMKLFSIDRLKIDQSFIRDIMTDSIDADIVSTIIAMAYNLGIEVIAEGVETEEQLNYLKRLKCREVQGYYYHRPLPAEQVEQVLASR